MLDDEAAFEDGTVNFLSIPDVTTGLDWISGIGIDLIHQRVSMLTGWLLECLGRLRHSTGAPMVRLYGPATRRGARRHGRAELPRPGRAGRRRARGGAGRGRGRHLAAHRVLLQSGGWRAGVRAEPQGRARARRARCRPRAAAGRRQVDDYLTLVGLPTGGAVRVSLGVASTLADVEAFLDFAERTYAGRDAAMAGAGAAGLAPRLHC